MSVLVLLTGNVELMLGESYPFLEGLVQRQVLPLLGEDLPPLAPAHLLDHLNPLHLEVFHLGGEEGASL